MRFRTLLALALLSTALVASCIPLAPFAIQAIRPIPTFAEATLVEGRFEADGEWTPREFPRYFVVNATGRHEFHCGYFGKRAACIVRPQPFRGQPIKVWTTFLYGALQIEVQPKHGERPHMLDANLRTYESVRRLFASPLYLETHKPGFLLIPVLIAAIWWVIARDRRSKPEATGG